MTRFVKTALRARVLRPTPLVVAAAIARGMLTVFCGPMFSGKSEELIRLVNRLKPAKRNYLVVKPELDTRSKGVRSRNTLKLKGVVSIKKPRDILKAIQVYERKNACQLEYVLIDEAQFLAFDTATVQELVAVIDTLLALGINVVLFGLDLDFKLAPFPVMEALLPRAHKVEKLTAVCTVCNSENAVYTQRLIDGKPAAYDAPIVLIGDTESYEARCPDCHQVHRPEAEWQKEFRLAYQKSA